MKSSIHFVNGSIKLSEWFQISVFTIFIAPGAVPLVCAGVTEEARVLAR